tara:strand:+ start:211 stop:438 length:228 start_codon:yes stop_codon:yes gene_type:complete
VETAVRGVRLISTPSSITTTPMINFIITQKQRFLKSKWYENYRHSLKINNWPLIDVAQMRYIEKQKQRLNRLFKK